MLLDKHGEVVERETLFKGMETNYRGLALDVHISRLRTA
jgi:DNA-binding response OmpR family regulator